MTTVLSEAIDRLYVVFGQLPRPASVAYCPCCFRPEEERALLAPVPLRKLSAEALQPYAAHVPFTVGDVADFRYFLPRLLEIGSDWGFDWPDLEPLVSRLRFTEWTTWPDEERRAVRGFLAALWTYTLAGDPDEAADVNVVLCAIGNAEDDLTPYLTEWLAALDRPTAAAQLRHLLRRGCRLDGTGRRLSNAFWVDRGDQAGQVVAWLAGPELRLAVSDAFAAADVEQSLEILVDIDALLG